MQIQIPTDRTSGTRTCPTQMLTNIIVEICTTRLTTAPRRVKQHIQWHFQNRTKYRQNGTNIFSWYTSEKNIKHITVNNTNIPIHNKAKFLGVTFDSSLSFKTHINLQPKSNTPSFAYTRYIINRTAHHPPPCFAYTKRSFFEYGNIAAITASPEKMNIWEGIQYRSIKTIIPLPHISRANVSKFGNLPFGKHRTLHLFKTWYNKAITHNTSIHHYINNHISKHPIRKKHNTSYAIISPTKHNSRSEP